MTARRPTLLELSGEEGEATQIAKISVDLNCSITKNEPTSSEENAKKLERRVLTITELFKTEATYVEYLQVAMNIFLRPLRTPPPGKDPLMSSDKIEQIFQNIEEIMDINHQLLKKMAIRKTQCNNVFGNECWIDLLCEAIAEPRFMKAYQKYIHGYNHANDVLAQLTKRGNKNTTLGNWVQQQLNKNSNLCRGLASLPAFLISPVQRLPRYLLLLKDLFKCTPEDHPDYQNVQKAYDSLSVIMATIDKEKLRYDEIYHLDALFQKFPVNERNNVQEMTDSNCKFITEGPVLILDTESNSYQMRYLIILANMIICAKQRKQALSYRWKVDLYNATINFVESPVSETTSPYFILTEQKKQLEHPFTAENVKYIYTFTEEGCDFTFAYWRKYLGETVKNLLNLNNLTTNANAIFAQLETQILTKRDWDLLAVGASIEHYEKGAKIVEANTPLSHLHYVSAGKCCIESAGGFSTVLAENDFFGEISFLKLEDVFASTVVVESEKATITKISFDRLTSMLSGSTDLASRFYRLLALLAARNYLRRASRAQVDEDDADQQEGGAEQADDDDMVAASDSKPTTARGKKINPALFKLKLEEIAPDEEILQEYTCKLKKTKFFGQFYVMKEYIGFYSQLFGKKTRMVVPGRSVTEVVARDDYCIYINHLKHNVPPFELQFKTKEQKEEAYTILASFLSDKKRSLAAKTGVNYTAQGQARRGSIFNINDAHWEALVNSSSEYTVTQGEVILPQGSMNDTVYQIIEGKCKVEVQNETTKETSVVGYFGPGELFGEISFLMGLVSHVSIIAETDVVVLALHRPDIENQIQNQHEFAASFYKLLSRTITNRLKSLDLPTDAPPREEGEESAPVPTAPIIEKKNSERSPLPQASKFLRTHEQPQASSVRQSSSPVSVPHRESNSPSPSPSQSSPLTQHRNSNPIAVNVPAGDEKSEQPVAPSSPSPSNGWIAAKRSGERRTIMTSRKSASPGQLDTSS